MYEKLVEVNKGNKLVSQTFSRRDRDKNKRANDPNTIMDAEEEGERKNAKSIFAIIHAIQAYLTSEFEFYWRGKGSKVKAIKELVKGYEKDAAKPAPDEINDQDKALDRVGEMWQYLVAGAEVPADTGLLDSEDDKAAHKHLKVLAQFFRRKDVYTVAMRGEPPEDGEIVDNQIHDKPMSP